MNVKSLIKMSILTAIFYSLFGCSGGGGSEPIKKEPIKKEAATCASVSISNDLSCTLIDTRESIVFKPTLASKFQNEYQGILLYLHGSPGNAGKVMDIFDAKAVAAKYGLIAVSPQGIVPNWGWLSGVSSDSTENTDIDFFNSLIGKIESENNISNGKTFVFGYSAGGFMAYNIACKMPEEVDAIISLAGQFRGSLDYCSTSTPVNIHHIHSPTDLEVPFSGRAAGQILSVTNTMEHWVVKNGCSSVFDIIKSPGVTENSSGTETNVYSGCVKSVALSIIENVPHEAEYSGAELLKLYEYLLEN